MAGLVYPISVQDRASAAFDKIAGSVGSAAEAAERLDEVWADLSKVEQKAAMSGLKAAAAIEDVAKAMADTAGETTAVQRATLGLIAAQDRLATAMESGKASAAALAEAQSAVIGAEERLAIAANAAAGATERTAAAQKEGASSARLFGLGFAGGVGDVAKMAGELGLLFGAVEAVKKAIDIGKETAQFSRQMELIQTQTGGTTAEVKSASNELLNLAGKVGQSPEALAQSLYHFESIGQRGAAALHDLTIAAKGATIGNADLEDTTNALTYTLQSGITGVHGLGQAMSVFNKIVGSGDMTMQQLVEAIGSHGLLANAKASGVSITEVGAALAVLGDNGIKGVNASTALIQVFNDLLKPAAGSAEAFSEIGLSAEKLRDTMQSKGLNATLQLLSAHLKASGDTGTKLKGVLADLFTKRASGNLAIIVGNMDLWDTKLHQLRGSTQSFGQLWNDTTRQASVQFKMFGAAATAEGMRIGSAVLPVASKLAGDFGSALENVFKTVESIGSAFSGAFKVAGGAIELAGAAVKGIASALSFLSPVIKVVAVAWASMWGSQAAARLVAAGITAVGTAIEAVPAKFAAAQASVTGFWTTSASAATAGASTVVDEAALMSGAVDTAAAEIDTAGATAEAGWVGLAGPIGLAAGAILGVITLFHHSTSASKEATAAAKAYSDALSSNGGQSDFVDAITNQLKNNNIPSELKTINASLGASAISGKQFVTAIQSGGKPLSELRAQLQAVITTGTKFPDAVGTRGASIHKTLTPAAIAATKALASLNTQYSALTKTAQKDLLNTKTFAGAASSIDTVAQHTQIATKQAQQYATMSGLVVDKNGIVAASSKTVTAAVDNVGDAYRKANETGSGFLDALNTFSQSGGASADRAALIGETLKANAGDALNFAGQINNAATAVKQLGSDVKGKLLANITNLSKGTIDYNKAAAGPLINDLQSIQSSAIAAAQATYQHNLATEGGKKAADDAITSYKGVESSLEDQLEKMGETAAQAKALTQRYLGVPSKVKTQIEAEGTDPVVNVLNKIGQQLSYLTGRRWTPTVTVSAGAALANIRAIQNALDGMHGVTLPATIANQTSTHGHGTNARGSAATYGRADGTIPPNTTFTVGEGAAHTWEGGMTDRLGRTRIFSNSQSKAMGFPTPTRYAGGSLPPGITKVKVGGNTEYRVRGENYASLASAENAITSAGKALAKAMAKAVHDTGKFGEAARKSGSDFQSAFSSVVSELKNAHVSSLVISQLRFSADVVAREADRRQAAIAKVAALRSAKASEVSTIHSAATGSFDIASAGTGYSGSAAVSRGSIFAQAKQDELIAKKFTAGVIKLRKEGLALNVVQQLAEAGPSAWPQVQALLTSTPKQLRQLNAAEAGISSAGSALGKYVGGQRYNGQIGKESKIAHEDQLVLRKEIQGLRKEIARLADRPIEMDGKKVDRQTGYGHKRNQRRA